MTRQAAGAVASAAESPPASPNEEAGSGGLESHGLDEAPAVRPRTALGGVQQQASILAAVAAKQIEEHGLLPRPWERIHDVEVGERTSELQVAGWTMADGSRAAVGVPGPPLPSHGNEASDREPGIRAGARTEVTCHANERGVELDPTRVEPHEIGDDRNHPRGGAPLQEAASRHVERLERGSHAVIVGSHEGVPVVLADLRVEALPVCAPLLTDPVDPRPERGPELRRLLGYLRGFYDLTARTVQATALRATPTRVEDFGETSKRLIDRSPPKRSKDRRIPEVAASLPVRVRISLRRDGSAEATRDWVTENGSGTIRLPMEAHATRRAWAHT